MSIEKTVETKEINVSPENLKSDPEARQFHHESWPVRRDTFKQNRNGEVKENELTVENWKTKVWSECVNPGSLMILIDGTFAHSAAVHYAKKYIDYRTLQKVFSEKTETLYYFSISQESDKIANFLNYIDSIKGCKVVIKNTPKMVDSKDKVLPVYKSVAVNMSVVALREAYDNPEISHALILSRDPEIIPLITELKDLEITVTLARNANIATSRMLRTEATHVVDVHSLFDHFQVYSDTEVKHKHEDKIEEEHNDE